MISIMNKNINFEELEASGFSVKAGMIAGEECYLITPKAAVVSETWNKDNLLFRSSIWTKDGMLVSGSFKKFFNLFILIIKMVRQ